MGVGSLAIIQDVFFLSWYDIDHLTIFFGVKKTVVSFCRCLEVG